MTQYLIDIVSRRNNYGQKNGHFVWEVPEGETYPPCSIYQIEGDLKYPLGSKFQPDRITRFGDIDIRRSKPPNL